MLKITGLLIAGLWIFTASVAQNSNQSNFKSAGGNFSQYLSKTIMKNIEENSAKTGIINSFNNTEKTTGKRFLFDTWVNGDSVINIQENFINTETYLFNVDELTGNLLVTQDKINVMAVAPAGINSFILNDRGRQYRFEHVKTINPIPFFLVLIKNDKKYSLYKQFETKFIKANFRNDGVIQTGNENDEYKDESKYYIFRQGINEATPITFKPKTIKSALEEEKEKVDAFFLQHKNDEYNESFLIGLINYLNQ